MAHNFVKQADGSKVCSWCGDEKNVDVERDCPRTQSAGPVGLGDGHEFHKATVILPGSKLYKGIRAHVYEAASTSAAFYSGGKEQSIFYEGNDLHVVILFETRAGCVSFVNNLDGFLRHFQLLEDIQFDPNFERLRLPNYPRSVFQRDYNPDESDSEAYSIAITRITHISNLTKIDFETELQMIENPNHEDFVGLDCYKCHLMGQAAFAVEKDNPNNWLWMSWPTHQRFDGLNTIGKHRVPQIAIKFVSRVGSFETFDNGLLEREKVEIAIECPDADVFGVMRHHMKPGDYRVVEASKTILTWVFVEDAADFQRCLTYKYEETLFCWKKHTRGAELTETEAHVLRRSARVAALAAGVSTVIGRK
jgi:hypothetical protein